VLEWAESPGFEGVLVLDEAHKAKSLCQDKDPAQKEAFSTQVRKRGGVDE
jgi:hypothetical protein